MSLAVPRIVLATSLLVFTAVGCGGTSDDAGTSGAGGGSSTAGPSGANWMNDAPTCTPTETEPSLKAVGTVDGLVLNMNLVGSDASGGLMQIGAGEFFGGPAELTWDGTLSFGESAATTGGKLYFDEGGTRTSYCVLAGKVGFTANDGRFVFSVTSVSVAAEDGTCGTDALDASLLGCWSSTTSN